MLKAINTKILLAILATLSALGGAVAYQRHETEKAAAAAAKAAAILEQQQKDVQDPSGAVIPKASVEFRNQDTGVRRQTSTNNDGIYHVVSLDPGKYDATVQAKGFKTLTRENIMFSVGDKAQIDFKMQVGEASQSVTVDGSGLQINTTDASVSTVVDRQFVENIPLNGRSFQDLVLMTPGVVTESSQAHSQIGRNGDFSINGQRTESNYYMVDGVSANLSAGNGSAQNGGSSANGTTPASTALGTTQSLISVDALQEFRVESSTYSAEYGHAPGGQLSFVTRSGTDSLHGSTYDYLRNNFFDANDWFTNDYQKAAPALRQNDFGGTFGGPIYIPKLYDGRKRSFFLASYEGLRLVQPQPATVQYVPDTYMRAEAAPALMPLLNAYPLQNGIDYGTAGAPGLAQFILPYSLPSSIDSTSLRVDEVVGNKLSLFFRVGITPSTKSTRTLAAVAPSTSNTATYTIGATSQLSSATNNEFRVGYVRADSGENSYIDNFGGAIPVSVQDKMGIGGYPDPEGLFILFSPGVGLSELFDVASQNRARQWNVIDTLGLVKDKHHIKLGLEFRGMKFIVAPSSPTVETEYLTNSSLINNAANVFVIIKTNSATPLFRDWSAFVQDEWRISNRLSASLGVRWELAPPPTEQHGDDAYTLLGSIANPSSLTLAPQGTPLWHTYKYNFAPRLGIAWIARSKTGWETAVRTGGGVFFDSANEAATNGYGGVGFFANQSTPGSPLPATPAQLAFTPSVTPPYTNTTVDAFPTHLQLPYTLEWNLSLQQAIGKAQSVTLSYVGSNGRRLIGEQVHSIHALNPNFGAVAIFPTGLTSNYQALQVQFQRSVSHGLQALASYTWSHSLDYESNYDTIQLTRGNSDFDVRHNLSGGITWTLPSVNRSAAVNAIFNEWAIDGRLTARTAFPVTLEGNQLTDPTTGNEYYGGVDFVPGVPIYLSGNQCSNLPGSKCPGGRALNKAAFQAVTSGAVGNATRNVVRGFGETQLNLAIRREFPLHEALKLQFRAESFNILNHPTFGYVDPYLTDATFGQATMMLNQSLGTLAAQYQQGGPRSMQFALKLQF